MTDVLNFLSSRRHAWRVIFFADNNKETSNGIEPETLFNPNCREYKRLDIDDKDYFHGFVVVYNVVGTFQRLFGGPLRRQKAHRYENLLQFVRKERAHDIRYE